jgi:hypothetical protein
VHGVPRGPLRSGLRTGAQCLSCGPRWVTGRFQQKGLAPLSASMRAVEGELPCLIRECAYLIRECLCLIRECPCLIGKCSCLIGATFKQLRYCRSHCRQRTGARAAACVGDVWASLWLSVFVQSCGLVCMPSFVAWCQRYSACSPPNASVAVARTLKPRFRPLPLLRVVACDSMPYHAIQYGWFYASAKWQVPEEPGAMRGATFRVSLQHPTKVRYFPQAPRHSRAKGPCRPHRAPCPPPGSRDPSRNPLFLYSINNTAAACSPAALSAVKYATVSWKPAASGRTAGL